MLVGSDETNYKAIEAAIGRKVDVLRCYVWNGANHARLLPLAQAGYILWVSYKFRTSSGAVISARSIPTHAIDADLDIFDKVMSGLPVQSKGKHRKGYEHEEDAKAAQASGTPAELNAAIDYCIARNKATSGMLETFTCWTGFDLLTREPQYRAAGQAADVIMLDPYELAPTPPWQPMVAAYKQDFDYVAKIYPGKKICLGEINAPKDPTGGQARVQWLNQARTDMESQYGNLVDGACMWQDIGSGQFTLTATELAGLKNGFFAPSTPVMPGVSVPQNLIATLGAAGVAYGQARTNYNAALTAWNAIQQSYATSEQDFLAAASALAKASDALTTAAKAITG